MVMPAHCKYLCILSRFGIQISLTLHDALSKIPVICTTANMQTLWLRSEIDGAPGEHVVWSTSCFPALVDF